MPGKVIVKVHGLERVLLTGGKEGAAQVQAAAEAKAGRCTPPAHRTLGLLHAAAMPPRPYAPQSHWYIIPCTLPAVFPPPCPPSHATLHYTDGPLDMLLERRGSSLQLMPAM